MNDPAQNSAAPGMPELRPHVYDGIQEYDQRLPNWWLFTFYIAIVWFVVYWFLYYQCGWFMTDHDRVTSAVAAIQRTKAKELEKMLATLDDKVLWEWSRNGQITAEGKVTYDKYCFTCHAPDLTAKLEGNPLPGLPLHDQEWKYGNQPMTLFHMVGKGSPDKTAAVQMPPWEQTLGPADIAKVVAYVLSHHREDEPAKITGPGPAAFQKTEAPAPPK
jgi:cytochrome c oxidase cbb3-type subunit III